MLCKGFILNKRYRIEEIIGRGGLSVVYRASDLEANGAVRAVKEISKECTEMVVSAKQESLLIKELYEHDKSNFFPNIIQHIETRENLYIVMDYIDGSSMSRYLKSGAFEHSLVLEYGKEICSVMQFLHDYGKIYSDMKPDNIMIVNKSDSISKTLNSNRRSALLKFIDFGAVVQMESGVPVQYTPEYAAPEQFRAERLDQRTDIFNIGATLYHMATGTKPLPVCDSRKNLRKSEERFVFDNRNRKTDVYLRTVIRRCVEDNPEKRFKSCRELYHALEKSEKNSHIRLTVFTAAAALISGIICLFSFFQYKNAETESYDNLINAAQKAASCSERISAYKNAAEICPDRTEAYFGLIEAYKEDVSFDENESYDFLRLVNANAGDLRQSSDYELLAFETGKLYWYYYDYGLEASSDNTTTRMKASSEWFADSVNDSLKMISEEKYRMARIYYDIGRFNAEIQKLVIEGDDADVYRGYWDSITALNEFAETSGTETEIVLLETYRLIVNSISTYAYKFSSFVPEDEIKALCSSVRNGNQKLVTTTEKTKQIQEQITEAFTLADEAVERAYGGK